MRVQTDLLELTANLDQWVALLADLPSRTHHKLLSVVDLSTAPPLFDFLLSALVRNDRRGAKGLTAGSLFETGVVARAIANSAILTPEQAMRLAEAAIRRDPVFDARLLEGSGNSSSAGLLTAPEDELLRVLEVVARISDGRHVLWPLMKLTRHESRRVRSKAVKLLGTLVQDQNWLERVAKDPDPRVRANLVEALSCSAAIASPSIVDAILRRAAEDSHHRVAVTALVALCRSGDQDSFRRIQELLNHPARSWQKAARWALSRIKSGEEGPAEEAGEEVGRGPMGTP